jgi:hypothetical protein
VSAKESSTTILGIDSTPGKTEGEDEDKYKLSIGSYLVNTTVQFTDTVLSPDEPVLPGMWI